MLSQLLTYDRTYVSVLDMGQRCGPLSARAFRSIAVAGRAGTGPTRPPLTLPELGAGLAQTFFRLLLGLSWEVGEACRLRLAALSAFTGTLGRRASVAAPPLAGIDVVVLMLLLTHGCFPRGQTVRVGIEYLTSGR